MVTSNELTPGPAAPSADWRSKSFPVDDAVAVGPECGWNLLDGDLLLPALVLKERALVHNLDVVHGYCSRRGVSIAPHVKTTMSPELIRRQLDAGAWGVTVATTSQARVVHHFGCRRILIANEVVDEGGIAWLARALGDASLEVYSLVDSAEAVELLDAGLARAGCTRPAMVLLEVGLPHGRTGCRGQDQIAGTLAALDRASLVNLAGVEAYEGIIHGAGDVGSQVDSFLSEVLSAAEAIDRSGSFSCEEIILTAGGSAFPDRVIDTFGRWNGTSRAHTVVRSGCYLTHDHGYYRTASPFGDRTETDRLLPALEIWGSVVSRPEPDLAIVNFGKRDVSYDLGLPIPLWVKRRGERTLSSAGDSEVVDLNDQHGYLRLAPSTVLGAGDMLGAGLSHPCTVFDKWRTIPVVNDDYDVISAVSTYF